MTSKHGAPVTNELKVPALRLQESPPVYVVVISGGWLLKHSTPSWRIKDPIKGFQRIVNDSRAKQIARTVLDRDRAFPNAITLATDQDFKWAGNEIVLPDKARFLVVDGQHRLWAQHHSQTDGRYPLRGGFESLMTAWLDHVKGDVRTNTRVISISPARHSVVLNDGSELTYGHLVSTMPLPVLIRQMGTQAPPAVRKAAESLRHVSVRCVHIGVGREKLTDKHWIYYPEDTVFHRIFVQGNASPHCNPPGGFGLTCEITYSPQKPLPCDGDELVQRCIDDCRRVGIIRSDDPIWTTAQCDLPHAYVVYDHGRAEAVREIREWLAGQDIILAGRYSEWEYYNSDHAFLAGKKAADQVRVMQREATGGNVDQFEMEESADRNSPAPSRAR